MKRAWKSKPVEKSQIGWLSEQLNISNFLARLLLLRGVHSYESGRTFLSEEQNLIPDPFLFGEMDQAIDRIEKAIEGQEAIVVHGDYDADGVTATAILYETLAQLGARVDAFVPDRMETGYDLRPETIEEFAGQYQLIITVDCGTTAIEAVQRANQLGIDVIITDHHDPGPERPPAHAVLNPVRPEEPYPTKTLSGAGVAWKLAEALRSVFTGEEESAQHLELAALGMVADIMPLQGENRILLKRALPRFAELDRPGLRALMELARVSPGQITSEDIAFRLGPRLNAAGRIEHPRVALDLLITRDEETGASLARHLQALNQKRQSIERKIFEEACKQIEENGLLERCPKLLFLAGEGWHRGVVGIVAAKLMRRYGRPVFLLGVEGQIAHGSARSVEGASLVPLLEVLRDHAVTSGGHAGAAGMTVTREQLRPLEDALYEKVESAWDPLEAPPIWVDSHLPLERIDDNCMSELAQIEPYGHGNPEPVFYARSTTNGQSARVVGNNHLQVYLKHPRGIIKSIGFGMGEYYEMAQNAEVELLFHCRYEEYQGRRDIGLHLLDMRPAQTQPVEINAPQAPQAEKAPVQPAPTPLPQAIQSSLDRQSLGAIYRLLRRSANETLQLPRADIHLLGMTQRIQNSDFDLALRIFAELDLLRFHEETIELIESEQKRDLTESPTFNALQPQTAGAAS